MKRTLTFTVMLAVSMLTTVLRGEDKLGVGLLCTRLVDRVTVSVESKRMLYDETVVVLTHKDPSRAPTKNSYGHFFIMPLYKVNGDGSVAVIGGDFPKISVSTGTVSRLRYEGENGIALVKGRWAGTEGVYIFDVIFGETVPDRITFNVKMIAAIEEMGERARILCSLSSDGRVDTESDRECSLRVIAPGGGFGAVFEDKTMIKADEDGWCVIVPDKYYGLSYRSNEMMGRRWITSGLGAVAGTLVIEVPVA